MHEVERGYIDCCISCHSTHMAGQTSKTVGQCTEKFFLLPVLHLSISQNIYPLAIAHSFSKRDCGKFM